jgi:acyl carrier protein
MVADRVIDVIATTKQIPASSVTLDVKLQDLGLDSLDLVDIIFRLEDEFGIRIDEKVDFAGMTVRDAVTLLEGVLAKQPPGKQPPDAISPAEA